ncbi:MAG: hypothetical protein DMG49_23850 [Acidobacteria bacterium]|nr:MAG: hypothetical protein DMG49_23850 [Acidobacteriota bacterium]
MDTAVNLAGIRTPDRSFSPYNGLPNCPFPLAKARRRARKVRSKAAGFHDRDLYAESSNLFASDSENPSTPNFAAAYGARPVGPTRPPIVEI